jgi:hypothetical protein
MTHPQRIQAELDKLEDMQAVSDYLSEAYLIQVLRRTDRQKHQREHGAAIVMLALAERGTQ